MLSERYTRQMEVKTLLLSGNIYDMMGRLLEETDSRGYKTINAYDGFGRVTATTYKYSDSNQLKQSTSKEYDENGNGDT